MRKAAPIPDAVLFLSHSPGPLGVGGTGVWMAARPRSSRYEVGRPAQRIARAQ